MRGGLHVALLALYQCVASVEGLSADEMVKIGEPGHVGRPQPPKRRLSTLVIHDFEVHSAYSSFFADLQGARHDLTFVDASKSTDMRIVENEVKLFDNIILFVLDPTESLYKNTALNHAAISEFVDNYDGSLLTAGGYVKTEQGTTTTARVVRSLANIFGADFDSENSKIFDLSSNKMLGPLPLVTSNELVNSPLVWGQVSGGVAFSGMGMKIDEQAVNFTFPILSGEPTHYSATAENAAPIATGSSISLVSAFQGRRKGRASFFGSFSVCSDEMFVLHPPNRLFCFQTALWTFQQAGVLTWSNLQHHEVGSTEASHLYRHSTEMDFEIELWITSNDGTEWVPYHATDVQIEYTMLHPYIRQFLRPPIRANSATYSLRLKAPDKTGIFKFVIQYFRRGLSNIHIETIAPLRHINNSEEPRFIRNAFPYYCACLTQLVCFFVFVLYFTFHRDAHDKEEPMATKDSSITTDHTIADDTPHESIRKRKTRAETSTVPM